MVIVTNTLGRMQIWTKKNKMENLVNDDLEKSSSDESDSESDDETESDNEKDNDESNKWCVKS